MADTWSMATFTNNVIMDYWPLLVSRDQMLNAGTDINGFEPVTLEEMIRNNQQFKQNNTVAGIGLP